MKKAMLWLMLCLALVSMTGCAVVQQTLSQVGEEMEAAYLDTPKAGSASAMDWSFVPVVRDMATKTFTEGVPDATIRDTRVAVKEDGGARVIVVIEYTRGGTNGSYGVDYQKNEHGEYELKRFGEGVRTDDLR